MSSSTSTNSFSPSSTTPRRRRRKKRNTPSPRPVDRPNTPSRLACSPYLVKLKAPISVVHGLKRSRKKKSQDHPTIRIRPLTSLDESLLPHYNNKALNEMRATLAVYFRGTKHDWYSFDRIKTVLKDQITKNAKASTRVKSRDVENIETILKSKREALLSRLKREIDAFEEEEDRYTQAYLQSNDCRFDDAFEKYKAVRDTFYKNQNTTDSSYDEPGSKTLFGKSIKNIDIENKYAYKQTNEEQYIFDNSVDEDKPLTIAFSDDQNFDAGKIIHAAVHVSNSLQPPSTVENNGDSQSSENYQSRLEDWNEEENEIALTALILQHKQRLLELWKMANGFDDILSDDMKTNNSVDMDSADGPKIPVRIQFLAHATSRRRIVKSVRTIAKWWQLVRSSYDRETA